MSARVFVSLVEESGLTREQLDECQGCQMNTWLGKPGSQFILCSYHEGFVDGFEKGSGC